VPKCLVRLGGLTLLERQIASLRACGIENVTVVVGYQSARVAAVCRSTARALENPRYAETNSLYSLWLARDGLSDGFVVLNADVLFHLQLLRDLLSSRFEDALLAEYRDQKVEPFGEEEMKIRVRGGCVAAIDKALPAGSADAENVGIAKFGAAGAACLIAEMDRLVAAGRLTEWAPRAFARLATLRPLHVIGTRGFPWIEIDFPEDYARAGAEVLPLIETTTEPAPPLAPGLPPAALPVPAGAPRDAEWRPQPGHV
jgi:choline kinase